MTMDRNIRVKTDRKYKTLYKQLTNLIVGESHELFFICACLGFKRGKCETLGKRGDDRFWSGTISPEEWACYYSMHLQNNGMDFQTIQDDHAVMHSMEQYANGGMAILMEDLLKDYTTHAEEEVLLDSGRCQELPKVFLCYLFELGLA